MKTPWITILKVRTTGAHGSKRAIIENSHILGHKCSNTKLTHKYFTYTVRQGILPITWGVKYQIETAETTVTWVTWKVFFFFFFF